MDTLDDYIDYFKSEVRSEATRNGRTPKEEFLFQMLEKLEDREEVFDAKVQFLYKKGRNGRPIQLDAYAYDENDKSIVLIINDYDDSYSSTNLLNKDRIEMLQNRMMGFLHEAMTDNLENYLDDSDEFIVIGKDIKRRFALDMPVDGVDETIEKIKLYIVSNARISNRLTSYVPNQTYANRQLSVNIWSIERLYKLFKSGAEKEPIEIRMTDFQVEGLPCLKAEMSEDSEYDAYLVIVPGKLLSDIYYRYGSRLLEGNVRAFLGVKNKVNMGIRKTIINNPKKFFTYNNGIAGTANHVEIKRIGDANFITSINDLQIINGGQTTASLTSAWFKKESKLEDIFVPMKLTVIKNREEYQTMVSDISRFANNQSKVVESDFFSNHPFHVTFEQLSERVPAPAVEGNLYETYWFYERSRGKYDQKQFKLKKGTKKHDDFLKKYPKKQVIKKEELAKYLNSLEQKPHIVSMGGAKCTNVFAKNIDSMWGSGETGPANINEFFFKRAVSAAIIFKEVDSIVWKADWYPKGGNKSNIVTYTIAFLMSQLPKGTDLDYQYIFKNQKLYPALVRELEIISYKIHMFLETTSEGKIISMYARDAKTWEKAKNNIEHSISDEFMYSLKTEESIFNEKKAAANIAKEELKVGKMVDIFKISPDAWKKILFEGKVRDLLDHKDQNMLELTIQWVTGKLNKNLTDAQIKVVWAAKQKVEDAGVII